MVANNVERLTFMEWKILSISKAQYDKGYSGGSFTPGLVRKETSYSYYAINTALESLIGHGLLMKTVTSTFRDGAPVNLDVYMITEKGLQAMEKIKSGAIKIEGVSPALHRPAAPDPEMVSSPGKGAHQQMGLGQRQAASQRRTTSWRSL